MTKFALFLGVSAMALTGCGDDDRGGGGGGEDGGGIVLMDSGPGGDTDAGTTPETDSGTTGPRECEAMLMPFPEEAAPRCSAETKTCVEACTDGACVQACLDADTTEPLMEGGQTIDCTLCIVIQQFYCLDSMGCHDEVAAFNCCIEDNGCTDQACVDANCSTESGAINTCAMGAGSACAGLPTTGPYAICYAE